jgi:hypothetical protein
MVEVNKTETNMTKHAVSWNSHVANTAKKKNSDSWKTISQERCRGRQLHQVDVEFFRSFTEGTDVQSAALPSSEMKVCEVVHRCPIDIQIVRTLTS